MYATPKQVAMATTIDRDLTNPAQVSAQPLLSLRAVAKHFGKNVVLRDISLEIAEGEFLTILGESGSGKTTLLRILATLLLPTGGHAKIAGHDAVLDPRAVRRQQQRQRGRSGTAPAQRCESFRIHVCAPRGLRSLTGTC